MRLNPAGWPFPRAPRAWAWRHAMPLSVRLAAAVLALYAAAGAVVLLGGALLVLYAIVATVAGR